MKESHWTGGAGNTEAALQRSTVMNYGVTAPLQRYLFILLQNHYMVLSVKSTSEQEVSWKM